MQIVHAGRMDWGENLAAHRHGGMAHKLLFEGEEGSPDNFLLVLAREGADYYSPRHRHAWDQVRLCLEGAIPIGKDWYVRAGEVGYFPEGVPYGPQEGGPDRLVLLLQFGGASGQGYLGPDQLRRARTELEREGTFERGVFRRTRGDGRRNEDAYEAIWRHVTGRPIAYATSSYEAPIVMRPEELPWRNVGPDLRAKEIGRFAERGLSLHEISLAPNARYAVAAEPGRSFIFVRAGEGSCDDEAYAPHTTIRLEPDEAVALSARTPTRLFAISVEPAAVA
ncbi:MAG TPA: hypothetical protein VKS60_23475 [Stellaceae bacterium]|nr:hypothetical protein [Stellaceae bacterium]